MKKMVLAFGLGLVLIAAGCSKPVTGAVELPLSKETKLYGASWCSHCQDQHRILGDQEAKITYIESSSGDLLGGSSQTAEAAEAGIRVYPTWVFADGFRYEGVLELIELKDLIVEHSPTGSE